MDRLQDFVLSDEEQSGTDSEYAFSEVDVSTLASSVCIHDLKPLTPTTPYTPAVRRTSAKELIRRARKANTPETPSLLYTPYSTSHASSFAPFGSCNRSSACLPTPPLSPERTQSRLSGYGMEKATVLDHVGSEDDSSDADSDFSMVDIAALSSPEYRHTGLITSMPATPADTPNLIFSRTRELIRRADIANTPRVSAYTPIPAGYKFPFSSAIRTEFSDIFTPCPFPQTSLHSDQSVDSTINPSQAKVSVFAEYFLAGGKYDFSRSKRELITLPVNISMAGFNQLAFNGLLCAFEGWDFDGDMLPIDLNEMPEHFVLHSPRLAYDYDRCLKKSEKQRSQKVKRQWENASPIRAELLNATLEAISRRDIATPVLMVLLHCGNGDVVPTSGKVAWHRLLDASTMLNGYTESIKHVTYAAYRVFHVWWSPAWNYLIIEGCDSADHPAEDLVSDADNDLDDDSDNNSDNDTFSLATPLAPPLGLGGTMLSGICLVVFFGIMIPVLFGLESWCI